MNSHELEPSAEVAHLRRLLEIQPGCLMRLSADGTVLAANNAALMLLGATSTADALGRDFALWVAPDQRERWRGFTLGVARGSPASIECDISTPSAERQPTLFHAVPLGDHPDGVASMAVAARVISVQRQLEAAIGDLRQQLRERGAERVDAQTRLAEAEARQRELVETVTTLEARLRQCEATSAGEEQLRQLRDDLQARGAALAASDSARRAAETDRARALADVRQLELALKAFADRQQSKTQQTLARQEQREQHLTAERDALQLRLEQVLAACREHETALQQLQSAHESLAVAHAAATAERDRLVAALREHAVHLEELANGSRCAGGAPGAAWGPGAFLEGPGGRRI